MKVLLTSKGKRIQMISILFVIFLLIPYSIHSLNTASKTMKQEIYDFARGSYDILLRPQDSRTMIENELGFVEENYLGIGDGGITIEQWQHVLNRDDVEVAAPVAAIGLYTASEISFSLPERKEPVRYTVSYTTTDGVHTYPLGEPLFAYTIPDDEASIGYSEIIHESLQNVFRGDYPSFIFPRTYHQVVAIDAEQEKKLTGEDFSLLESGPTGLFSEFDEVPILSLAESKIPLKAEIQIDTLKISPSEWEDIKKRYKVDLKNGIGFVAIQYREPQLFEQLLQELSGKKPVSSNEYVLDFSKVLSPFYDHFLYADENYEFHTVEDKGVPEDAYGVWNQYSQETFFDVYPVAYKLSGEKISIKQVDVDEDSGIPLYRKMEEKSNYVKDGPDILEGKGVYFKHVGYFDVDRNDEALAASPLGIYGIQPTLLAKDRDIQIHPTALPGSFITTPAHGVISINWAERLKGEAPIDAIRVRVAGIDGYDQAAARKIKNMAAEFEKQGFTVDIVAGASHQWLNIDVEGFGEVVQPWTSLGAADTIIQSWDIVKIVLVVFFSLVSLIYLFFSFLHLLKTRKRDEALLLSFGWTKKHIRHLRVKEWIGLFGIPFMLAFIVLFVIGLFTKQFVLLLYFLSIFFVTCFILFLVSMYHDHRKEKRRIPSGKGSVTWQNVWHYRHSVSFSVIQIVILTVVSLFLTSVMALQEKRTVQTTLGVYVHGEMEWFYIILLITLYSLAIMTLMETLMTLWKQRSNEMTIFHHIGWGKKELYKFYLGEVFIWSLGSVLIGFMVSVTAYQRFFGNIMESLGWVIAFSVSIFGFILFLSYLILAAVINKATNKWYKKVK